MSPSGKSVARLSNAVSVSASLLPRIQCTRQPSVNSEPSTCRSGDAQFAVAEQDQGARLLRGAGAQDRREVAMRVAGDDDGRGHAGHLDHAARPKPSRRAAVPIVHPWITREATTTMKTPENSRHSRLGSASAGMMLR